MKRVISREAVVPLLIGILAIAGIGLTAATLDSTVAVGGPNETDAREDREETPVDRQEGPPSGGLNDSDVNGSMDENDPGALSRCIEPLNSTPGTALVGLGFLAIIGVVFHRYNFSAALLVGWTILPPVALVYFLLTNCTSEGSTGGTGGPDVPGGATALELSPNVPPSLLFGVVGVVLVAAVGLMYRSIGEEEVVTLEDEMDEEPDLDEFAAAAGRAADNIEEHDVDVDNAVYRAWVEMTDLIDVENPDTYSAGEFQTAAVDLGMAETDVAELTRLFNEVRYGDRDAATREDRAVSVLRDIESAYGTDDRPDDRTEAFDDRTETLDDRTDAPGTARRDSERTDSERTDSERTDSERTDADSGDEE